MRIKAVNTSFIVGTALVLSGQEVDAPKDEALYLISIGAAEEVQGGKGVTLTVEVDVKAPEEVKAQVEDAVQKMTAPKRKQKKEE